MRGDRFSRSVGPDSVLSSRAMARRVSGGMVAGIALAGALFLCCVGGGALVAGGAFLQSRVAELGAACDGQPVPSAAAFVPGTPGPHRVTVMQRGATGGWTAQFGRVRGDWSSDTTASTQIVVCLEPETERIAETCEYEGGRMLTRVQYDQRFRVVAASTGTPLFETAITGGEATVCPEILVGDGMTYRYDGPHVADSATALETLLQPIVAP